MLDTSERGWIARGCCGVYHRWNGDRTEEGELKAFCGLILRDDKRTIVLRTEDDCHSGHICRRCGVAKEGGNGTR